MDEKKSKEEMANEMWKRSKDLNEKPLSEEIAHFGETIDQFKEVLTSKEIDVEKLDELRSDLNRFLEITKTRILNKLP